MSDHLEAQRKAIRDSERLNTREDVLRAKTSLRDEVAELSREAKGMSAQSPEKARLYREIQRLHDEQDRLETLLDDCFVPQHSPNQLISPRAFFVSPLFRVCSKKVQRSRDVSLELKNNYGQVILRYSGPELRQSDGLVFMALLNLVRDVRAGDVVSFSAEELCHQIFKRYDGPARAQLRDHIKRLQRGLVEFERVSVQLCLRFEFPARGLWSVALDKDIVQLFKQSPQVWLDFQRRKELPEGLTTWLYSFVESQTRLIPMQVGVLREMCGSDAADESFVRTLRIALKELAGHRVIDTGWTVAAGVVHWRKAPLDAPGIGLSAVEDAASQTKS